MKFEFMNLGNEIKQEEVIKEEPKATSKPMTVVGQLEELDIAKVTEFVSVQLGLTAKFLQYEEGTGEKIYKVIDNNGESYIAKYLGNPFNMQTYHKDENIEWWKSYDENCEEIYYRDSTGTEIHRWFNPESNEYEVYVPDKTGEVWDVDKQELDALVVDLNNILGRMDQILQCYIDTNGNMVSHIESAFSAVDSIAILIQETNDYYSQPDDSKEE